MLHFKNFNKDYLGQNFCEKLIFLLHVGSCESIIFTDAITENCGNNNIILKHNRNNMSGITKQ